MASTEGLVPITRAYLAKFYDKYSFAPLSEDVDRLSNELRKCYRSFLTELPDRADLCRLETWYYFGIERMKNSENTRNFDSLWLGPYIIRDIGTLEGEPLQLPANGQLLKLFFRDDI